MKKKLIIGLVMCLLTQLCFMRVVAENNIEDTIKEKEVRNYKVVYYVQSEVEGMYDNVTSWDNKFYRYEKYISANVGDVITMDTPNVLRAHDEGLYIDYENTTNSITIKESGEATFYIRYMRKEFNIIYDEYGGSNVEDTIGYKYESTVYIKDGPNKDNNLFLYWLGNDGNTYKPNQMIIMPLNGLTLTAVYEEIKTIPIKTPSTTVEPTAVPTPTIIPTIIPSIEPTPNIIPAITPSIEVTPNITTSNTDVSPIPTQEISKLPTTTTETSQTSDYKEQEDENNQIYIDTLIDDNITPEVFYDTGSWSIVNLALVIIMVFISIITMFSKRSVKQLRVILYCTLSSLVLFLAIQEIDGKLVFVDLLTVIYLILIAITIYTYYRKKELA